MADTQKLHNDVSKRAPKSTQMERTKKLLMNATMELLSEIGYRSLTIDLITERAGVARSTLYRHWQNIPDLAIDSFDEAIGPNFPFPETDDIERDLTTLFKGLSKSLNRSVWGRALPALIEASHNDPKFHGLIKKMHLERRKPAREMVNRAISRGELVSNTKVDRLLDAISGPLYFRLLISRRSIQKPELIAWLVRNSLREYRNKE